MIEFLFASFFKKVEVVSLLGGWFY